MIRRLSALLTIGLCLTSSRAADPPSPPTLSVLFLGDRGHHHPGDRAAQLAPVLRDRGIEVTYTENAADLNPGMLAKYDALVVYANIDRIEPDQEKALLDYVAGGKGFVPLHCASYCFRNSPDVVALIGAQFQRHGTGDFDTQVVDANQPVTKGLEPFRTWDETYVHTKHNEVDRHVLQTRREGEGEEPWTWVRTQGKGRVFYTAYGHDGRTWGNPAFHDLVERGIRWASNKGEVFDSHPKPRLGSRPFTYDDPGSPIPLYLPGKKFGAEGSPIDKIQQPLSPEESAKHLVVPRGFEARLFVAEPEIAKPITMAWDHRGRLWIAESTDYPNNLQPPDTGNDRIKICEDTDGDGRADKFTVFADKLSIPTSITFSNGGVIIFSAPNTVFLKDTDGDDKADERRVLFTGWGTRDTHAGPSNLHYGLDNWIWGIVGYSGFAGTVGGESFRFAQGFFRFKPDGSKLEFLRNTSNNSWGVSFTEEGLVFGSTANGCPSVYLPIPNRYYESVRGWSSSVLASIAASNRFYPLTDKVRQVDWHGGFTAAAGHAIYTARTYPRDYWNRAAFVTEPTGHLAATFLLERNGSDFVSNNSWNLVASDDEWTSPIFAEVGPDGHVWVIDWYNHIVQHNPTPQGFQTGAGNAYVTPLRDKTHGRIYRIVYADAKPSNRMALDPGNAEQLVAALRNDNMFWRNHAQRLLVERGGRDVAPNLVAMVNDRSVDALGLNPGAIHALGVLHGLGLLDGKTSEATAAAVTALSHPSAGVRRNALEVLPRTEASARAILSAKALEDTDAQVRLAAFLALSEMPPSDDTARLIVEDLLAGRTERHRWLNDAATTAASANAKDVLRRLSTTKPAVLSRMLRAPNPAFEGLVGRVAEHYARGVPAESVGALVANLGDAHPRVTELIVAGLARGWPKDKPVKLTDADEQAIIALLPKLPPSSRGPLVSLSSRWGGKALEKHTGEISTSFLSVVKDDKAGDESRAGAARQLVEFRPGDVEVVKTLLALVNPRTSPDVAVAFVSAVAKSDATETGMVLVESLPSLTPTARAEAVRTLIGRESWAPAFMTAVEQGKIQLAELSLDQKQALTAHPNRTIARRARELLARGGGLPDADRQKVVDELSPLVLKSGDPTKGKAVFTQQCAKCHRYNNEGGKVGPDLSGMAAHPRSELLVHILDPSRSVEGNFLQYSLVTTEGRILTGLLSSETKTAVELIDAEGKKQTVLRQDIDELAATKKSLMPEGFEKQVNAEGLADLLAFLTQRGKYMPLDLRKVATANSARGMFQDRNSTAERLVFPDWSPKTFEGVPFTLVDPTEGDIPNVVMLHGPKGPFAPTMPLSVTLPFNSQAKAIHFLSGVSGWGAGGRNAESTVSMVVRLNYAGGVTEDFPLRNGVEFADYIRRIDVPGSKFAFALGNSQIRYFAIAPGRTDPIESIELRKGSDDTAPIVMAVTVETAE